MGLRGTRSSSRAVAARERCFLPVKYQMSNTITGSPGQASDGLPGGWTLQSWSDRRPVLRGGLSRTHPRLTTEPCQEANQRISSGSGEPLQGGPPTPRLAGQCGAGEGPGCTSGVAGAAAQTICQHHNPCWQGDSPGFPASVLRTDILSVARVSVSLGIVSKVKVSPICAGIRVAYR